MRKSNLFWLMLLALWIIVGCFLCWNYLCKEKNEASEKLKKESTAIPNTNIKPQGLGDWTFGDGDFKVVSKDYISYEKDGHLHISPLAEKLDDDLESVVSYLNDNPQRALTITGHYGSEEKNNNPLFANLGLYRANEFKKHLVTKGAPSGQLDIEGKVANKEWFEKDELRKGINFTFSELADGADRLSDIKTRLDKNPIRLYFETNSRDLNMTDEQRSQFADLKYYLDQIPDSELLITGHTDNVGNSIANQKLSNKRAVFVRDYLVENGGIDKNRMAAEGKRDRKPIAPNSTEAGRAKNRRVEIGIK